MNPAARTGTGSTAGILLLDNVDSGLVLMHGVEDNLKQYITSGVSIKCYDMTLLHFHGNELRRLGDL